MKQPAGEQVQGAVFAAEGAARHRMVRVAVVGGMALLAAWLIALALGVLGGFEALPVLPGTSSGGSSEASTKAHATPLVRAEVARQRAAASAAAQTPTSSSGRRVATKTPRSGSTPSAGTTTVAPTAAGKATRAPQGQGIGLTRPSGKPTGSPGNGPSGNGKGPGGGGAPGQLR